MKHKSHRVLKSVAFVTKRARAPTLGVWANRQVSVNLIGADEPAAEIGVTLIQKGVSLLRIYDSTQVVQRLRGSQKTPVYCAVSLANLLATEVGNPQTQIIGYPFRFDRVIAFPCDLAIVINADAVSCSFYNDYFHAAQIPYLSVTQSPTDGRRTLLVHAVQPAVADHVVEWAKDGNELRLAGSLCYDGGRPFGALVGEAAESIVARCDPLRISASV